MKTRGVVAFGGPLGAGGGGPVRWRVLAAMVTAAILLLTAGCSHKPATSWKGGEGGGAAVSPSPTPKPASVAVVQPKPNATDVVATTEIKYKSEDPENTTVVVKDSSGDKVNGTLNRDKKTWRAAKAFDWGATYTITVNGTETEDKVGTVTTSFTVMPKPSKLVRVSSFLGDGATVGVGMPLIVKFSRAIPQSSRATVERRMIVTSTPKQIGTWHWMSSTEVHYRPKKFWVAGSKVWYTIKLQGVPLGDGWYGRYDLGVTVNIGRAFVMTVSNQTKSMTVTQNGKVVNTIPVSLGKESTPSSSGTMVVIEKKLHTVFDTLAELGPEEGYRTDIDYAQRITWSGQFIHAAPWSEGVQGKVNVSHGCVNVSEAMGKWLFDRTMMGDPITVSGTGSPLKWGNGWTDWNISYDQYRKGSAL